MSKFRLIAVASALTLSAIAYAHDSAKPEDVIDYRQGLMTVIGWNFGPLAAMTKGKHPFDAAEFSRHAGRIAQLSDQILEGFAKGSDQGKTAAKADVWANWDDFQSKAKDLDTQAKLLAEVAKANDEAKDKEQFKKVAETCKACHDKYKKKD